VTVLFYSVAFACGMALLVTGFAWVFEAPNGKRALLRLWLALLALAVFFSLVMVAGPAAAATPEPEVVECYLTAPNPAAECEPPLTYRRAKRVTARLLRRAAREAARGDFLEAALWTATAQALLEKLPQAAPPAAEVE
jgi:hypothetical protein